MQSKIDKRLENSDIHRKRDLSERVDKIEIALILLINQLHGMDQIPEQLLINIEKILLSKGVLNGKT